MTQHHAARVRQRGNRIALVRASCGWTQRELGIRVGLCQRYISALENGHRHEWADLEAIQRVCAEQLGQPVSIYRDLLGDPRPLDRQSGAMGEHSLAGDAERDRSSYCSTSSTPSRQGVGAMPRAERSRTQTPVTGSGESGRAGTDRYQ